MGLGADGEKVESCHVGKSNGKKKKKDGAVGSGCWIKLRFIGSCISSRSKVDSSLSGISTHCDLIDLPSSKKLFPAKISSMYIGQLAFYAECFGKFDSDSGESDMRNFQFDFCAHELGHLCYKRSMKIEVLVGSSLVIVRRLKLIC